MLLFFGWDGRQLGTRAVVLLPRIEGEWIALEMIAVDLRSGTHRTLLAPDALPRRAVLTESRRPSEAGLIAFSEDGRVLWRHRVGVDATDWTTGETRPVVRWTIEQSAMRRWTLVFGPRQATCISIVNIGEDRQRWVVDAWHDGAPRRLLESQQELRARFLDEDRLLVADSGRATLLRLDGSPPQVLFP